MEDDKSCPEYSVSETQAIRAALEEAEAQETVAWDGDAILAEITGALADG